MTWNLVWSRLSSNRRPTRRAAKNRTTYGLPRVSWELIELLSQHQCPPSVGLDGAPSVVRRVHQVVPTK